MTRIPLRNQLTLARKQQGVLTDNKTGTGRKPRPSIRLGHLPKLGLRTMEAAYYPRRAQDRWKKSRSKSRRMIALLPRGVRLALPPLKQVLH